MALLFTNEEYDSVSGNINANVGDWIECQVDFLHRVEHAAGDMSGQVIYRTVGGVVWLERLDLQDWKDDGFVGGGTIRLVYVVTPDLYDETRDIDYLDGDKMFIDATLPGASDGSEFPYINSDGDLTDIMLIVQTSAPQSIDFDFNLAIPEAPNLSSLIDGNINRFKYDGIDSMALSSSVDLFQIGNKSGGYLNNVELTYISIDDEYRKYTITYRLFIWAMLQSGFSEPDYLSGIDTLGAVNRVRIYSQTGNPNSILQDTTENTDGNIGGFNENYNTGINPHELTSVDFTNSVSDPIEGINYCGLTHFVAEIESSDLSVVNSIFTIGLVWRTVDEDLFQNKLTNFRQNIAALTPFNDFIHSVIPDPTTYTGNTQPENGIYWQFENLQFTISGTTLTVEGDIIPGPENSTAFDALGEGEKRITFWVSPDRSDQTAVESKRTSITLYDQDAICVPEPGGDIDVIGHSYIDHGDIDITEAISIVTTEDDTLYRLLFNIDRGILKAGNLYKGLQHKVVAVDTITGDQFTLEQFFIDFSTHPVIAGKHEVYHEQSRGFNLPPSTNKNVFALNRQPGLDSGTLYAFLMDYGFLNRWEYWLTQDNADDVFFDPLEPNSGKNKDWQRISDTGDWTIRMVTTLIHLDGIGDTFESDFEIRPYDDEDVTKSISFVNLADGSTPTALIADALIEVTAVLTWNAGIYSPPTAWLQATIEDYEASNRWVISSYLPHEGVSDNPLQPIDGAIGLDVVIVGNVATLKYIINTSLISVDQVSITHRIHSEEQDNVKLKEDGTAKITEIGSFKIKD